MALPPFFLIDGKAFVVVVYMWASRSLTKSPPLAVQSVKLSIFALSLLLPRPSSQCCRKDTTRKKFHLLTACLEYVQGTILNNEAITDLLPFNFVWKREHDRGGREGKWGRREWHVSGGKIVLNGFMYFSILRFTSRATVLVGLKWKMRFYLLNSGMVSGSAPTTYSGECAEF